MAKHAGTRHTSTMRCTTSEPGSTTTTGAPATDWVDLHAGPRLAGCVARRQTKTTWARSQHGGGEPGLGRTARVMVAHQTDDVVDGRADDWKPWLCQQRWSGRTDWTRQAAARTTRNMARVVARLRHRPASRASATRQVGRWRRRWAARRRRIAGRRRRHAAGRLAANDVSKANRSARARVGHARWAGGRTPSLARP